MRRKGLLFLLSLLAAFAQDITEPPILRGVGFDQKLNARVPLGLAFRDERGEAVTLKRYFGKRPVVLSLVYYECPMLCGLTLNGLLRTFRTLAFDIGDEYEVVTVSINPRETPQLAAAKKKFYMEAYRRSGSERGWHFLTGEKASIDALAQAVGFRYVYDPATGQYAHAAGLIVLTPDGRVAGYQYGVEYSAKDLRLSLVDAADGKIGSPVDRILLFCFTYHPETGKYGATVMSTLRAGAVLTLAGLAGLLVILLRRERQARPAR